MSTPSDSFPAEEPQHDNSDNSHDTFKVHEAAALTGEQAARAAGERQETEGASPVTTSPPSSTSTSGISTSTLPPEAQGEANGGPLGCCLGVTVGLLLSLSIAVLSRFYADPLAHIFSSSLSLIVRVIMILIAIVAIIVCGYFGWKIGKNAYREYDPPVVKDRRKSKRKPSLKSKQARIQ